MSQLEDMRIYLEAVERGGFSAAAGRLGLSKQLVSRRVAELEARLGVQLLIRTTRKLTVTELGRDYALRVRRILADVDEAEQAVSSHAAAPRGTLRMTAPLSFGVSHLSPLLAGFLRLHPAIELDLDLTDRTVDLVAEGYDMAVRIGALPDSTLVARRLVGLRLVVCASPDYLRARGVPTSLGDLKQHACLLFRHGGGLTWHFRVGIRTEAVPMASTYRANNGEVLRDAAVAGLGLAQLPVFMLGAALDDGRLMTVLDDYAPSEGAAYAVHPDHRQRSVTVRAMSDYLATRLAAGLPKTDAVRHGETWGGAAK